MYWALLCGLAWAAEDDLGQAREELAVLVAESEDPELRQSLEQIDALLAAVQEADALAAEAQIAEDRREDVPPTVIVTEPISERVPCTLVEYEKLRDKILEQGFARDKIAVLASVGAYQYFSVDQVIGLLDVLDFGTDKVEAAALLHPRLVDPMDFDQVYEALVFETDRQALRGLISD